MPIYYITETKSAIQRWEFEVTADSEEEALQRVTNGEVDPIEYITDEDQFEESEYSVDWER